MKYSTKYKYIATFIYAFILALSLMVMFLLPKGTVYVISETEKKANTAYYVIKVIALAYLVLGGLSIWKKDATFAKYFPLTITAVLFQFVPALARIGFASSGKVGAWVYFLVVIIGFFFVGASLLYAFSNDQFREQENKAQHSSNYYKK